MRGNRLRRLARIQAAIPRPQCPTCANFPTRVVSIDEGTDTVLSETLPESGCPMCGRPVWRTVHIVAPLDVSQV